MTAWVREKNCALCNKELKSHYRIYFKPKKKVTTCMECYYRLDASMDSAVSKAIEEIFQEQRRSFAIEDTEY